MVSAAVPVESTLFSPYVGSLSDSPTHPVRVCVQDLRVSRGDGMSSVLGVLRDRGGLSFMFRGSHPKGAFGLSYIGGWTIITFDVIYRVALLLLLDLVLGRH